ncbi:MAG: DUF4395 domain-containing protein [Actinomycetes bacterium]
MKAKEFFSFPNPVNDYAARTVAGGVVLMSVLALSLDSPWILIPLSYGFLARVATGPRLSPLGQLAMKVIGPRLSKEPKLMPGPPKRFAQGVGLAFAATASILTLSSGWSVGRWVLVPLIAAAFLEAAFGICLGCMSFAQLMRAGIIPETVCEACNDISLRRV